MTFWMLYSVSCVFASYRDHGELDPGTFYCALLQVVYLLKFFATEIRMYIASIDIIVDRASYYETWGCLVFVPTLYTQHTRVAASFAPTYSWVAASAVAAFGLLCFLLNTWTDEQRTRFRREPERKLLCHSKPPRHVVATRSVWNDESQQFVTRTTLLLADGWWGWVRHPQYIFEIGLAWTWAALAAPLSVEFVPGKPWTLRLSALCYPLFITLLLIGRCQRDAAKCQKKYGAHYDEYKKLVPYQMVWGIY